VGGYIQHSIIDFGDCFGSIWEPPMMGRRTGHSHYFAGDHVLRDWLSLGLRKNEWDENRFGVTKNVLGYYKVSDFEPDAWRPGYPNPAMLRMTERDGAWMARILARITPEHIVAMLQASQIRKESTMKELTRVVLGRRLRTLSRYLSRLSPLTEPEVKGNSMCLEDLAVTAKLWAPNLRKYSAIAYTGNELKDAARISAKAQSPKVCVELPPVAGAGEQSPQYLVVDVFAQAGSSLHVPARVHLYALGAGGYRVVGLERPDSDSPPS
jgi:hypothetical protein